MVDPAVYGFVNYDPKKVSGFAFGIGIDRLAMLKYGIDDIQFFPERHSFPEAVSVTVSRFRKDVSQNPDGIDSWHSKMTFANAKQRFSNRVADYVRYRPGYPAEVLRYLAKACGLHAGHIVADIGSDGFAQQTVFGKWKPVYGIEPNGEMLAYRGGMNKFLARSLHFTVGFDTVNMVSIFQKQPAEQTRTGTDVGHDVTPCSPHCSER